MILSLLFYAFLAWMLYRLVFGFIIPLVRATRQVKKGFRNMQEQMNAQYGQHAQGGSPYGGSGTQQSSFAPNAKGSDEDYIEFEEVK
ncbi:hypothetical protein [Cnuella takakiae]|nr:hypothetical protein [Cnuella takakiae]